MITRVLITSLILVATSGRADCKSRGVEDVDVIGTSTVASTGGDIKVMMMQELKKEGVARSRKLRYQITAEEEKNANRRVMEVDKAADVKVHLVPMQVLKGLYGMPGIDPKDLHQAATSSSDASKDLSGLRIRYTEIEIPKRKDQQALSSKRSPLLIRLLDESNSVEGSGPESDDGEQAVVQQPRGFSRTVQEINDLQYQSPQQQQQLYLQHQEQQYQGLEPQHYQTQQLAEPQYQSLEPQYHEQQQHGLDEQRQQNLVVEPPQVKQVIVSGAHRTPEEAQPESEEHFSEVGGDPNYQFSYAVRDADKGADFGHEESKSEGRTSGQYWLTLPDGRRQRVRYWADSKGFRATVHYSDP